MLTQPRRRSSLVASVEKLCARNLSDKIGWSEIQGASKVGKLHHIKPTLSQLHSRHKLLMQT
jgi:hypothetical protein